MKRFILTILLLLSVTISSVRAQSLSVGVAEVFPLSATAVYPSVVGEFRSQLNPLVSATFEGSIVVGSHPYHTFVDHSSLLFVMGIDCIRLFRPSFAHYTIEATAGYGWGHQFGHLATDHNYHAYSVGFNFAYPFSPRTSICLSSDLLWRTWQGHMGFNRQYSAVRFDLSVRYYLLH